MPFEAGGVDGALAAVLVLALFDGAFLGGDGGAVLVVVVSEAAVLGGDRGEGGEQREEKAGRWDVLFRQRRE